MNATCNPCGWVYDAKNPPDGVKPGTPFNELPADFVCPVCGAGKEEFTVN